MQVLDKRYIVKKESLRKDKQNALKDTQTNKTEKKPKERKHLDGAS